MTKQNVEVNDEKGQMNVEHDCAKVKNTNLGRGGGACVHYTSRCTKKEKKIKLFATMILKS